MREAYHPYQLLAGTISPAAYAEGPPVVEGIFEQLIEGSECLFASSRPTDYPSDLTQQIVDCSWLLTLFYQHLGYVGRCSFDMPLVGRDAIPLKKEPERRVCEKDRENLGRCGRSGEVETKSHWPVPDLDRPEHSKALEMVGAAARQLAQASAIVMADAAGRYAVPSMDWSESHLACSGLRWRSKHPTGLGSPTTAR